MSPRTSVRRPIAIGVAGAVVLGVVGWMVLLRRAPGPPVVAITYRLVATADDGLPLADVALVLKGKTVAKTDARGELTLPLRGRLGAHVPFAVTCPSTHLGRPTIPPVVLRPPRTDAAAEATVSATVVCDRRVRRAAVLVRVQREVTTIRHDEQGRTTTNVAVEPLMASISLDGKRVAEVEDHGVAHLALERPPGTKLELEITPDGEELEPFAMPFDIGEFDDVYLLERTISQTYETRAARPAPPAVRKKPRSKRRPARPSAPINAIAPRDAPFRDL